ncbi:MAG: hypothetical protein JWL87_448 [Candidatus Adlerbacteria bacterium]|nr:hypothetical protein [Candidatus Adlerbacteria bacterium]
MNKTFFIKVATCIFTLVGLVHLYRALNDLPFVVAGWAVPVDLSWAAGVVLLLLAWTGYRHWR